MSRAHPPNLLFLGAGASRGARSRTAFPPPLGLELRDYLGNFLHGFHECRAVSNEADPLFRFCSGELGSNYEDALRALAKHDEGDRKWLDAINQLLAFSFTHDAAQQAFRWAPDLYDKLVERLQIEQQPSAWRVISLNYDILFEDALERAKIPFIYRHVECGEHHDGEEGSATAISLYKIHGSHNWFPVTEQHFRPTYGDNPLESPEPVQIRATSLRRAEMDEVGETHLAIDTTETIAVRREGVRDRIEREMGYILMAKNPVMAHYCEGKISLWNSKTLERIRKDSLGELEQVQRALIVGVGVRPLEQEADDPVVRQIFHRLPRERTDYVSVHDPSTEARVRELGFTVHCCGLEAWLDAPGGLGTGGGTNG
jgi:hypothetical protein